MPRKCPDPGHHVHRLGDACAPLVNMLRTFVFQIARSSAASPCLRHDAMPATTPSFSATWLPGSARYVKYIAVIEVLAPCRLTRFGRLVQARYIGFADSSRSWWVSTTRSGGRMLLQLCAGPFTKCSVRVAPAVPGFDRPVLGRRFGDPA